MSAIQDLSEHIAAFPARVKEAKAAQQMTNDTLTELSGVSSSAVNKLLAGAQAEPKLYNVAAICKVLGLSLDNLFDLAPPPDSDAALLARAHEAELDAAAARGESAALRETFADTRAYARRQARSSVTLAALCAVLAAVVLAYMLFDHTLLNAGLIRNGDLTPLAWVLVALLVASFFVAGRTMISTGRKLFKKE